ncbi:uncharacterized protein CLUP02_01460 [Colletotrichum lupini]|uniref:Uncharacterized protein n=1 Tax=Colletotrichum lupini TaxID=145971 RepID=A0A9Q8SD01_9PEZI|nr:uncharacterized protein CLUP02_01460 [Colletotrichum lupini]UQC74808.1 hypothetical protein CLUP02_01460 [Colletotrichum lupini]
MGGVVVGGLNEKYISILSHSACLLDLCDTRPEIKMRLASAIVGPLAFSPVETNNAFQRQPTKPVFRSNRLNHEIPQALTSSSPSLQLAGGVLLRAARIPRPNVD